MEDLGLHHDGTMDVAHWGKVKSRYVLGDTNRLINRVAALTDRRQHLIFDALREFIDKRIEQAIAEGTFNAGPETLKATSLTVVTDRKVQTDRVHGGSTRILRIRKKSELATVPFKEAFRRYLQERRGLFGADFKKHHITGDVALIAPGKPIITALGDRIATNDVITPLGITNRPARFVQREPWTAAASMEKIEAAWNAKLESASTETTSFITIVADALLPVWPILNKASGSRTAVYRIKTDEGVQVVGRPIAAHLLPHFCSALDVSARPDQEEVDEIIGHLKAGSKVALASTSASPLMLSGDWSGGRLTGVSLEITEGLNEAMAAVLDALPGAGPSRRPGTTCAIASKPSGIAHAVAAVLGAAPATFIAEQAPLPGKAKKTAKPAAAPAAAVQALAAA